MAIDWVVSVEDLIRVQERQAPLHPGTYSTFDSSITASTTASIKTSTTTTTASTKAASASALPWYNPHGWSLEALAGNGQCNQLLSGP